MTKCNSGCEGIQAEKLFPYPEGELFEWYKQFRRSPERWPERKLQYLACPFCVLQPELYKGVKNSACQGWGSHDISALRDHVHSHLPEKEKEKTQQPSNGNPKDPVKTQDDIPRICQSRIDSWKKMKSNRKRPRKSDKEEWWDIAHVALGAKIPERLPDDVHLAFCTGFSLFRDFWEFCYRMSHGGKITNRSAALASPRCFKAPKIPTVIEFPGARDYSMDELNDLVRNRPDNGATFVPAAQLADSAYHGSQETFPFDNAFIGSLQPMGYDFIYNNDLEISDTDSIAGH